MPVRPVLLYGDHRLSALNHPVQEFGPKLDQLIRDMLETCWDAPGLGLAAPQLGINLRLAVIDLSLGKEPEAPVVLVNPEIISGQGRLSADEGCLSFPGLFATISRPRKIVARAQDGTGEWRPIQAEGILARAICHEIDHLDGVLMIDHLRGPRRWLLRRRAKRLAQRPGRKAAS